MSVTKKHDKEGGFTLIELSIIIIVLSLIITPLFAMMQAQRKEQEVVQDEAVNERVLAGLSLYLRQNGHYPCPANPDLGPGDANFGSANCGAVHSTPGAAASGTVYIGALPVRDLNLPFKSSANNYGWKYIYAVSGHLTAKATYDGAGLIQVLDDAGNPFVSSFVQFVVVNPGKDGKGASNLFGGSSGTACFNTALDGENCNGDAKFREAAFAKRADVDDAGFYDDTISYSLAREESTFWMVRESAGGGGGLDISNRNIGNVGIGTDSPAEKMHISGGNVRVQAQGATGGNVKVDKNVEADGVIKAKKEVQADQRVVAPTFYYSATP